MASSKDLSKARVDKKDEFYTQMCDIERELQHYEGVFRGKVVYCNCDDPKKSNFWRYFHERFEELGLKRLISTHYSRDIGGAYRKDYTGGNDREIGVGEETPLLFNGDFRIGECIDILEEADICVTNPPFSLFLTYIGQLLEYGKQFIIIGNQNAVTNDIVLNAIKENKLWFGYGFENNVGYFINNEYEDYAVAGEHKEGLIRVNGVTWFTNIDIPERHKALYLEEYYEDGKYEVYDNLEDAINVDEVKKIPFDYIGLMGVPITYLYRYCPEQFEIVGMDKDLTTDGQRGRIKGKTLYARVIIKRRLRKSTKLRDMQKKVKGEGN